MWFFSGNPDIIHITPDQQEAPGAAVKLTCVATGIPPPMVSWLNEALEPVTQIPMEDEYTEVFGPTEAVTQSISSATVYVSDEKTRQVK